MSQVSFARIMYGSNLDASRTDGRESSSAPILPGKPALDCPAGTGSAVHPGSASILQKAWSAFVARH